MKFKAIGVALLLLAIFVVAQQPSQGQGGGQAGGQKPPTPTVAVDIPGVIKGGTTIEPFVRDRSQSTEGPNRLPDGNVIFSERPLNRVTKVDLKDNSFSVWLDDSLGAQGMSFDPQGNLVATQVLPEDTAMTVGIIYPKDKIGVIADVFDGVHLTRPNDLTIMPNGGVYFTDPGREKLPAHKFGPTPPLPKAIYYIPPGTDAAARRRGLKKVFTGDAEWPKANLNGLILGADSKVLFAHDMGGEYLSAWDINPDGTLKARRNFAKYEPINGKAPGGDGMGIDAAGNIYACTTPGLQVYGPDGQYKGQIPMFNNCQNIAFVGADRSTLFATAQGILYKIPMVAKGLPRGR